MVEDFRDKEAGGSQMVDHKKCRGYVNFKLKLLNLKKSDFRNKKSVNHGKKSCKRVLILAHSTDFVLLCYTCWGCWVITIFCESSVVPGIPDIGGGGGGGEFRQFSKFQGVGVEEFLGSRGMRIYGGWQISRIQGGWPMSDNDIFQGVQAPEDTMRWKCDKSSTVGSVTRVRPLEM